MWTYKGQFESPWVHPRGLELCLHSLYGRSSSPTAEQVRLARKVRYFQDISGKAETMDFLPKQELLPLAQSWNALAWD